ncbi:hypothetical protein F6J61_14425 [Clostridium perfringens]|nr:hypothetical protein CYK93_16100 [Clostridium perfringens]PWX54955.1 hypothetical protein CYK86_15850 [Clostridium perfringens]RHN24289.1 hypothetical protein DWZ20_11980 [Clostridium perfringens]
MIKTVLFHTYHIFTYISIYALKQLNIFREGTCFFYLRGLLMPSCRSPPFLSEKKEDILWHEKY